MSRVIKTDDIMLSMGFSKNDKGPYISKLWKEIERKILYDGLVGHGPISWAPDSNLTKEEEAKAILEVTWDVDRGYSHQVRAIDGLDTKDPMPWIKDQIDMVKMKMRIFRDKCLGIRNPYRDMGVNH